MLDPLLDMRIAQPVATSARHDETLLAANFVPILLKDYRLLPITYLNHSTLRQYKDLSFKSEESMTRVHQALSSEYK